VDWDGIWIFGNWDEEDFFSSWILVSSSSAGRAADKCCSYQKREAQAIGHRHPLYMSKKPQPGSPPESMDFWPGPNPTRPSLRSARASTAY
jgi:hypothetical protein